MLIFKIRSYSARSDLKNKSARFSGKGKKNRTPQSSPQYWHRNSESDIDGNGMSEYQRFLPRVHQNRAILRGGSSDLIFKIRSGQEVCFGPPRTDPGRNARKQDKTRVGRDGPHLGTWMGPKRCKTKHMANLDGTPSDPGWDLDGPRIGPRLGSGWHAQRQ